MSELQAKQMDFLRKCEPMESLSRIGQYNISCNDCGEHKTYCAAASCMSFIEKHRGHRTWLTRGKMQPSDTLGVGQ